MVDTTTILILFNIVATLFGFFRIALVVERRLTKMETLIEQHEKIIDKYFSTARSIRDAAQKEVP